MEEASRGVRQLVVHLDFAVTLVSGRLCLDLENNMSTFKGGIIWRQALLSPTEDNELLFIFLRKLLEHLPKVLNERAVLGIVWVVFWVLSVPS